MNPLKQAMANQNTVSQIAGAPASLVRTAVTGMVAGMVGAMGMAMYAMIASITYHHVGFFTPLYHIASTFSSPTALMTSMQRAMAGHNFYLTTGPALVGMIVHLAVGAVAGAVFAVIVGLLRRRVAGAVLVLAGMAYGLIVLGANAFVGLPVAASLFGGGTRISTMPSMVGWWTFTIEHLIFGMVLAAGLLAAALLAAARTATAGRRNARPTPTRSA
jgi:hypothetical protein